MKKPKARWRQGWPELSCPACGTFMGWLGGEFWLCYHCKMNRIWVGFYGVIGGPNVGRPRADRRRSAGG